MYRLTLNLTLLFIAVVTFCPSSFRCTKYSTYFNKPDDIIRPNNVFNFFNYAHHPQNGAPVCGAAPLYDDKKNLHKRYNQEEQAYIVNEGFDVKPGQFPFLVKLAFDNVVDITYTSWECSGVIVSPIHIITSAHCIRNATSSNIMFSTDIQIGKAGKWNLIGGICKHPSYAGPRIYDSAILTTQQAIKFDHLVQPICFPFQYSTSLDKCFAVGYGGTGAASDKKYAQYIPVEKYPCLDIDVDAESCSCFVYSDPKHPGRACLGDSGGAIACRMNDKWYLHGVISRMLNRLDEKNLTCEKVTEKQLGITVAYNPEDDLVRMLQMSLGRCNL